jgi:hypothetical protein
MFLISASTAAEPKRPGNVLPRAWERIQRHLEADRYRITSGRLSSRWQAANRGQSYLATFDEKSVRLSPRDGSASWGWGMETVGWGREGAIRPVPEAKVAVKGNRLEYRRGALTEWYVTRRRGVEQGFTIKAPPSKESAPLTVELALSGGLTPRLDRKGRALTLHDAKGRIVLRYAGLQAFDAEGKHLPAHFALRKSESKAGAALLALLVEDAGAAYPVTIDPVITNETKKLLPPDDPAFDGFGESVSVSGDTIVVGTPFDDDKGLSSGSAYVFGRNEGGSDNWGFVKKLLASDGAAFDDFGKAVSVNGDTVVVGAWGDDDNGTQSGSAYVFGRDVGGADNWGEVEKLLASDGANGDRFGRAVSISGDAVFVGSQGGGSGSAYLFVRAPAPPTGPDADGDGIADDIDGTFNGVFTDESGFFSNNFTDQHLGGTSVGRIFTRSDLTVTVEEAPNPGGVLLEASGGTGRALVVMFCNPLAVIRLRAGNSAVATCSSLTMEVLSGPVEIEVGADILVTVPAGATVKITQTGEGQDLIESDPESTAPIIVETGGQVVEIKPGETSGGCDCGAPGAIIGTDGPDFLVGTDGPDIICALGGDDKILAYGGDDCIDAGPGADGVSAGGGNDMVFGREGDDSPLRGGRGDDFIDGGEGEDSLNGGSGTDECVSGERLYYCEL